MMQMSDLSNVLIVGAGVMGTGIAQIVAQSGHTVLLYDACSDHVQSALATLEKTLDRLVCRQKITLNQALETRSRIHPAASLAEAAAADMVIEAITEDLEAKMSLFQSLEEVVSKACILASNTSSLSITRIGRGLAYPHRLVGMHFFNPAPVMKLVEIISGMQTSPTVAEKTFQLAESWGKRPVFASSTPGFIVNRIARPYYAEALSLLQERALVPADLDRCFRAAGFRMGPCELMDLIGHDTNHSVTSSIFEACHFDRRFTPSQIQRSLIDAGFLGRKSGRGFYDYTRRGSVAEPAPASEAAERIPEWSELVLRGTGWVADHIDRVLNQKDVHHHRIREPVACQLESGGRSLRLTDGRMASQIGKEAAVFDLALKPAAQPFVAFAVSHQSSAQFLADVTDWFRLFGFIPLQTEDSAGLVVARTLVMLINEAADAVQQGVCSEEGADVATRAGLNFPAGPFEWLTQLQVNYVVNFIDNLDRVYRGERYRVSPWLRRRVSP